MPTGGCSENPPTPGRAPAEGGQEPPGVVEVGKEAGAKRGMDVAARHGGDPREQQPRDRWKGPAAGYAFRHERSIQVGATRVARRSSPPRLPEAPGGPHRR